MTHVLSGVEKEKIKIKVRGYTINGVPPKWTDYARRHTFADIMKAES